MGFLLEGGSATFPLEDGVWSLPVNLFRLSNRSGGIKSFITPFVLVTSFCLPSMYGRRQSFVAVCPCLVEGTTLSVVELILAHGIREKIYRSSFSLLFAAVIPASFAIVAMTTAAKMALDVEETKRSITEALGDKSSRYWELLKNWYRKKVDF